MDLFSGMQEDRTYFRLTIGRTDNSVRGGVIAVNDDLHHDGSAVIEIATVFEMAEHFVRGLKTINDEGVCDL